MSGRDCGEAMLFETFFISPVILWICAMSHGCNDYGISMTRSLDLFIVIIGNFDVSNFDVVKAETFARTRTVPLRRETHMRCRSIMVRDRTYTR